MLEYRGHPKHQSPVAVTAAAVTSNTGSLSVIESDYCLISSDDILPNHDGPTTVLNTVYAGVKRDGDGTGMFLNPIRVPSFDQQPVEPTFVPMDVPPGVHSNADVPPRGVYLLLTAFLEQSHMFSFAGAPVVAQYVPQYGNIGFSPGQPVHAWDEHAASDT